MSETDDYERSMEAYRKYREEYDLTIKRRDQIADLFDKSRVTLSTAGIAAITALHAKEAPFSTLEIISISSFVAGLLCSLWALYLSMMTHHRKAITLTTFELDRRSGYANPKSKVYDSKVPGAIAEACNVLSAISISVGVIFMALSFIM